MILVSRIDADDDKAMLGGADVIQCRIFYDGKAVTIAPPFGQHRKRRNPRERAVPMYRSNREIMARFRCPIRAIPSCRRASSTMVMNCRAAGEQASGALRQRATASASACISDCKRGQFIENQFWGATAVRIPNGSPESIGSSKSAASIMAQNCVANGR